MAMDTLRASDLGLADEDDEEALDVLDLPQLYTKPAAKTLLVTLDDLSSQPPSWETTPRSGTPRSMSGTSTPLRRKPKVKSEGVPRYLTNIISSPLAWIEDDEIKEQIWEAASVRLGERSGRTARGAISRSFAIPLNASAANATNTVAVPTEQALMVDDEDILELTIHEPALTADNLGLKTWASSFLLAKRLVHLCPSLPTLSAHARILELGAGTGLVGMAAAAVLKHPVVLTDLPAILPNLERNIRSNAAAISAHGGASVETAVLDWSDPSAFSLTSNQPQEQCPPHSFPIILAADPIYSDQHARLLVQAIDRHLSRDHQVARVIVEMPIREAYAAERQEFRDRMIGLNLKLKIEGEEVGYDDWIAGGNRGDEELAEVRCWWSVWEWQE